MTVSTTDNPEEPTLSELLAAEMASESEPEWQSDGADLSGIAAALRAAAPQPGWAAAEEADWLVSEGALLPLQARQRMLAAADDAILSLRMAHEQPPEGWEDDWLGELAAIAPDAGSDRDQLRALISSIADGRGAVGGAADEIHDLVERLDVDPLLAYSAIAHAVSVAAADGIRPTTPRCRTPVMAGASDDEVLALTRLRTSLAQLRRRHEDGAPRG